MEETHNSQINMPQSRDLPDRQPTGRGFTDELPKLLLASSSPRRSQILQMVGWPFDLGAIEVDESLREGESARAYVARLAAAKALASAEVHTHRPVLAADTTVVVDQHILAKPEDIEDGKRMLRLLQGRWHQVLTGIALISTAGTEVDVELTEVRFAPMTDAEIDWYVSTREPMDKAGAYAIQGIGARYIESIKGDYFNAMGLPIRLVYELMRR